jgi:toxin ParE1/3/4
VQTNHKIEILNSAFEDLKKIEDYYLLEFGIESAIKVSNHILDCINRLAKFPNSGSCIPDDFLDQQGYKMVIAGKHIAIYKVINNTIYIYHIADSQTQYSKLF